MNHITQYFGRSPYSEGDHLKVKGFTVHFTRHAMIDTFPASFFLCAFSVFKDSIVCFLFNAVLLALGNYYIKKNLYYKMKSNLLRALIIGAPASGKGTISNRIIKNFDIKHISSGDLLRRHILDKTELGQTAEKYITKGLLVPDGLMINLITSELKKVAAVNWLLDGFPRTKKQSLELNSVYPVNTVINLVVPYDVIVHRVQQRWIHAPSGRIYNTEFSPPKVDGKDDVTGENLIQRPDDQPAAVQRRLDEYSQTIQPVLEYYHTFNIVHDFHGKTSDEIWPQVQNFLSAFIQTKRKYSSSV